MGSRAYVGSYVNLADYYLERPYPSPFMVGMAAPVRSEPSHDVDMAMQKYIELQSQHEELTQYLDVIRQPPTRPHHAWSSAASITSFGGGETPPQTPTLSSSPTSFTTAGFPSPRRSRAHHHPPPPNVNLSSTSSLDTVWDEDVICEVEVEEQRLADINEGIKRALTELLNCEVVRHDRNLRMWVQCRLMETEKERRSGRRKRSAY